MMDEETKRYPQKSATRSLTSVSRFVFARPPFSFLLTVLSFVFLPFTFLFADVTLNATVSRSKIYLGETVNLTVEVNGADRGVEVPDLSAVKNAEIQFLGQNSNSRTSISIINGRMSREVYEGRVFAFQIKPNTEGSFLIGPVRVRADGKSYEVPGARVQVSGVEKQDAVRAAVTASSTSVLVEEPFTVTLSVAIAELPDPYAENNEPVHPRSPPQISAEFLEIKQDMPGLKGPDLNQVLNGLIDQTGRQPDFAINNYQTRDMAGFGGLFDDDPFKPRPIRFRLPSKRITLDGKKYREYTLSLNYTPTKEGEFTFGPLSFKGTVISDVTAERQAVTRDVYAIGPAVTVRVVPPPDEGRPECFIGSVGKDLKATAAFDTTVCKVGDPLTLTLELTGAISVSNLRTPVLNLQPELTKVFRIYDDNVTADTLPNGKRFKYRVRPTHEGTLEFPPIKVAYYDTAAKAYRTVFTSPIPIQAQPTTQIATAADDSAAARAEAAAALDAPRASGITLVPEGTHAAALLPPRRLLVAFGFGGPLVCLLAALVVPLRRALAAWQVNRLRSGALHRARAALRHAKTPDQAARAVRDYLADRLGVSGQALTPSDAETLLTDKQVPAETARVCGRLLARLDEALYRPDAHASLADLLAELQKLLPGIDAALDDKKRKPSERLSQLSLLLVLFSLALSANADDAARAFLWEQANAQAASADKPEAFLKAATTYNRLVADGVRNAPLFINLGNTLVMAGDGANAAAAFERAERYVGSTPETRQGLKAAAQLQSGHKTADLPWYRIAFFWHYLFPCPMRALAALAGWTLFWLGVFGHLLSAAKSARSFRRSLSETCMVTGALIAVVFAASTLVTLMHERHDDATWGSRVLTSSSSATETEAAP